MNKTLMEKISDWSDKCKCAHAAQSELNRAQCAAANARNELGKALCPKDALKGECFHVWCGKDLLTARYLDHGEYEVFFREKLAND